MTKMRSDKICVFIGKRGQGKTTAMKYVLANMTDKLYSGIVFSPTERANGSWGEHVPELFIYTEYNPDMLHAFLKRQEHICDENVEAFKRQNKRNPTTKEREGLRAPPAFVVFEDCFFDKNKLNKDNVMRYLFMNGRHYNIFVLITLQWLLDLDTRMRSQIDYIFFSKETNPNVKRKIYNHYFGFYPSYDVFDKAFKRFTKDRGCVVLNTTETSNDINKNVYWFKAEYGIKFKLGCIGYRQYGRQHYDRTYLRRQYAHDNKDKKTSPNDDDDEPVEEQVDWNKIVLKDETIEEMQTRKREREKSLQMD